MAKPVSISIVGTVGLPATYGGFETLVENLVLQHELRGGDFNITVFCSTSAYKSSERRLTYHSARLQYLPFKANGVQSILYDCLSILISTLRRDKVILVLGVSGAVALPIVRLFSPVKIVTNIDGIEWKRKKWGRFSRLFLRWSESLAVKYSHEVIADNSFIAEYVSSTYKARCSVIAYGGDNAISVESISKDAPSLPDSFSLSVCRIEPENNIHVILEAFAANQRENLVLIGNWSNSEYGVTLRSKFRSYPNLLLLDPIYSTGKLRFIRERAKVYVHGHSAGGTNPSLVEAMHFGIPIFAFDCEFNRATTENKCLYFQSAKTLLALLAHINSPQINLTGEPMREIAQRRYTWSVVSNSYFDLLTPS